MSFLSCTSTCFSSSGLKLLVSKKTDLQKLWSTKKFAFRIKMFNPEKMVSRTKVFVGSYVGGLSTKWYSLALFNNCFSGSSASLISRNDTCQSKLECTWFGVVEKVLERENTQICLLLWAAWNIFVKLFLFLCFRPCCCQLTLGRALCLASKDTFPSARTPNHAQDTQICSSVIFSELQWCWSTFKYSSTFHHNSSWTLRAWRH